MGGKMSNTYAGMIIGGLIPAIIFAVGSIFQKVSNKTDLGLSIYLIFVGVGVIFVGLTSQYIFNDRTFSFKGSSFAFLQGLCFSSGILLFALGLTKYGLPISQLAPLVSTTTLFTVILGLIVFAEYSTVNVPRLFIGSLLIVVGAIIVGSA